MSGNLTVKSGCQIANQQLAGWPANAWRETLVWLDCDELPDGLTVLVAPNLAMETVQDWQGVQPKTFGECRDYDWVQVVDPYHKVAAGYEGFPIQAVLDALVDVWDDEYPC